MLFIDTLWYTKVTIGYTLYDFSIVYAVESYSVINRVPFSCEATSGVL